MALVTWYHSTICSQGSLVNVQWILSICFNFPLIYEEVDVACGVCKNVALPKRADQAVNFECNSF